MGVGAEDLWQSLSWQAEYFFPDDEMLQDIIAILQKNKSNLPRMSSAKIYELADALNIEPETLQFSLERMSKLDPYPARRFLNTSKNIVYPDIVYRDGEQGIEIVVQDQYIPELNLNLELYKQFKQSLASKQQKVEKEQWDNKYKEAQTLLNGIRYTNSSLLEVSRALLEFQSDFFFRGPTYVKPLNLKEVADKLGLHISTISRIVSHKYCQCQWGVFALKYFFPSRIKSKDGSNKGSEDLKQAIIAEIVQEDRSRPLSDQKIQKNLQEKGFDVQRRTVAKYRKLLHIPPANDRKVQANE